MKNCENISQFFLFIGIMINGDEIEKKDKYFISGNIDYSKWVSKENNI